jgi:DNA repair exonuclease SbcCD nuclease subunit
VLSAHDPRFLDRTEWLVDHRNDLNLRFVTHTGDVVNWDTADHSQYQVVSAAMRPLEAAGIPYSMAIGNHDTQATGVGGSARDPSRTYRLQRDTTTFNAFFNAERYGGDPVEFEPGKVDNLYTEYQAGGMKWMVLVLELWPRAAVVAWAKQQVAAHPHDNVIVVTHDYVSARGGLDQTAPYGDTTPQQLFDQLIKQYPNIKMVFSGHTGVAGRRVDTGVGGNKIYDYLGTFHSNSTDPMRLVTIDTHARTIRTWIYCPYTNQTMQSYTVTETGVSFVH